MVSKDLWKVLEIAATKSEQDIKNAYRTKLVTVNPEDDAEGFKQLREAYEAAIQYAKQEDTPSEVVEKDEIDHWIDRVNDIYMDMEKRRTISYWIELLKEEICLRLDINLLVREKFLGYLMNHIFLPYDVWQLINREFQIIEEKDSLSEEFPVNFISYIVHLIEREGFLDYSLFEPKSGENMDAFITTYFELKALLDEQQAEGCLDKFKILEEYTTYHPYVDCERAKYHILMNHIDEAALHTADIIQRYPKDVYVRYVSAKVKYHQKVYEEALEEFQQLKNEYPDHYFACLGTLECKYMQEKYIEAKDIAMGMLENNPHDEVVGQHMKEINVILMKQYQDELRVGIDYKVMLELAWCQYQNNQHKEALVTIKQIPMEYHKEYDYINLCGRAYFAMKEFEIAIEKLQIWIDTILTANQNGSKEDRKRYARLGYGYYLKAMSYYEIKQYSSAIEHLQLAIKAEYQEVNKLTYQERLAFIYLTDKKFLECIDTCNNILRINQNYYPVFLHRQEANFELGNDQEVINDYHQAIEIVPDFIKPYLMAIKVYLRHDQPEQAEEIAQKAKEQNLSSNEFKLLQIQISRKTATTGYDRKKAIDECYDLKYLLHKEENDIKDLLAVDYEIVLLYADGGLYEDAIKVVDMVLNKNPDSHYFAYIKGLLYKDMGMRYKTIQLYKQLIQKEYRTDRILYEIGDAYIALSKEDTALQYLLECVEVNENYFDAYDKLVDIYKNQYKETGKKACYEKALPYAHKMIAIREGRYSHICRGLLYMAANEFELAIEDYQKALFYDDKDWAAMNNIGHIYMIERKMAQAVEMFQNSIVNVPLSTEVLPYYNLANAYRIMQEYDKAIDIYLNILEVYPKSSRVIRDISEIYHMKLDFDHSMEWLGKLEKDKKYYYALAELHHMTGDYDKANRTYYTLYNIQHVKESLVHYSKFLLLNKKIKKAIYYVKLAAKVKYEDKYDYIMACEKLASICWSAKLYCPQNQKRSRIYDKYRKIGTKIAKRGLKAISTIYHSEEEFLDSRSRKASHHTILSSLYLSLGELTKADEYIRKAITCRRCSDCCYGNCICGIEILGLICEEKNQFEDVRDHYQKLVNSDPGNKSYQLRLNNVLEKLELRDKGVKV